MSRHVMICQSCYVVSQHSMSGRELLLHNESFLSCVVTSHNVTLCNVKSCYPFHVTRCHAFKLHTCIGYAVSQYATEYHWMPWLHSINNKDRTRPYLSLESELIKWNLSLLHRTLVQVIPVRRSSDAKQDSPAKLIAVFAETGCWDETALRVWCIDRFAYVLGNHFCNKDFKAQRNFISSEFTLRFAVKSPLWARRGLLLLLDSWTLFKEPSSKLMTTEWCP